MLNRLYHHAPEKHEIRDLTLISLACLFLAGVCLVTIANAASWRAQVHSGWLNPFDTGIEQRLNLYANRSRLFDVTMTAFVEHNLIKGAPIVFLYWMAFFPATESNDALRRRRIRLAAGVPLALFALALTRVLAQMLPFRDRPMQVPLLNFHLPFGETAAAMMHGWISSSFPSDHAALFMSLAVGVWLASRRLGAIAIAYTVLFIFIPRLYLGIHWPTDLIVGGLIGAGIALIACIPSYSNFVWSWLVQWWQHSPGTLAASAFLLSYEITDLFASPIKILSALLKFRH